ncbi:hypothetical protein ACIUZ0_23470 [Pseudomonas aeruginosa]
MTFNTGNNVPSTDPRDLYDNAENLDKLVNGVDPFYADRKGKLRQSWAGMENDFDTAQEGRENTFTLSQADKESRFQAFLVSSGYVSKGDYAAGVVLAERNEYVAVSAATTGTTAGLYRPGPGATLPLTLTGTWATDSTDLVLLGDDVLRQELAQHDGGDLVGWARTRLAGKTKTARTALDAAPFGIFEFAEYVTDKPSSGDPATWDWAPAIAAAITKLVSNGGGVLVFPAGYTFPCRTKVGAFVNVSAVTIVGYGATIVNYTGPLPMMIFGDGTTDIPGANGRYTSFATTVRNVRVLGLSFRSGNPFGSGSQGAGRWADATPLQFHTSQDVVIRDCSFTDLDFSAIDFGAASRDCLVDRCRFYSSQTEAGHANYGVRIFCYSTSVNVDLSPTDPNTGLLKAGYTLPPETGNFGHENISVTNCYFENISHGVMVFAGRRGVVSNNTFVNLSTRSISLTTYTTDYLCHGNVHSLNTAEQVSSGVSVFYNFGQQTFRNSVKGDKFLVFGSKNNATGFSPVKGLLAAREVIIEDCEFNLEAFNGGNGQFCVVFTGNSDARISGCRFKSALRQSIYFAPTDTISAPAFQQPNIEISRNTFSSSVDGAIQLGNTTNNAGNYIIKDNIIEGGVTRFVVNTANTATSVPKLFLEGNRFVNSPVRYIDNATANKAVIRSTDVLEFVTLLSTTGTVANPSTTSVTFDFSGYTIPACFSNGTKQYQFSAYGGRENAQASTDFIFRITAETATSVTGEIVRNAGTSTQTGYVSLRVLFTPFNT